MEKPVNPHGSRGPRVVSHFETPFEHTEEGLEAAALRVPAETGVHFTAHNELDKAADSVIAEITGAKAPELTEAELEAATAPKA